MVSNGTMILQQTDFLSTSDTCSAKLSKLTLSSTWMGVFHKDLVSLLDDIYTGETQIPAKDVNRFIEAAQELKIKGLVEELMEPEQTNPLNTSVVS